MYKISMDVDGVGVDLYYDEYDKAVSEFKECVVELLNRSDETDGMIVKIEKEYAICHMQNEDIDYVLELKKEEGE